MILLSVDECQEAPDAGHKSLIYNGLRPGDNVERDRCEMPRFLRHFPYEVAHCRQENRNWGQSWLYFEKCTPLEYLENNKL